MDADFNRHASAYARNAPPRVGLRLGAFSNPEHKSSFAKLHDSDPGRGMRKVFMCIMLPPLFFFMWVVASVIPEVVLELQAGGGLHSLFTLAACAPFLSCNPDPLDGNGLVSDTPPSEEQERIQRQRVEAMAKDFVGEMDYRMLIETIWQQFPEMNIPLRTERALVDPTADPSLPIRSNITELDPTAENGAAWKAMGLSARKDLLDPEVFLRMKLADAQLKMCQATLWALVEKRKVDRAGAVAAEPVCNQIPEMMKVVDLGNVVRGGTRALTPEQVAMLNGMMGRTMQDVFRSAYQTSVLFSPPHDASESPTVFAAAASDGGERVYAEDRDAPDEGTRGEAGSVGRQEGYGFVGDTSEELAALATQLVLQRQAVATSGSYAAVNDTGHGIVGTRESDLMANLEEATCVKQHDDKLGHLLRLRWCQMESTVNNAAGATLMESLSAAILRVQSQPDDQKPNVDDAAEEAGMTAMERLLHRLHKSECRVVLVGTSDTRFPMFLEKVLTATAMQHCQISIYEPDPRLHFLLQSRLTAQGLYGDEVKNTKLKLVEVGPKKGTYTVKLPGAQDLFSTVSHDDPPALVNAQGVSVEQAFVPRETYHEETVERLKLDSVLCEDITVRGLNKVSTAIPSCEVGEVPLVTIASHAEPTAVLGSFPRMLRLGYVGALVWEATHATDIVPQLRVFARTNYTVFVAVLPPANMVTGYNEPQLIRLDTDPTAVMTVKALMAHHQLNVTLLAIRTTHPYLRHATADVLQCENPCVAGSRTLGRPFGEGFLSEGSGRSCVVPEMCMCAVLEPPPQVLAMPLPRRKERKQAIFHPKQAAGEAGSHQACVELDTSWDRLMSQMFPKQFGTPPAPPVPAWFQQLGFIRGADNLKSNQKHQEALKRQKHKEKREGVSSKVIEERFAVARKKGQLIGHPHAPKG